MSPFAGGPRWGSTLNEQQRAAVIRTIEAKSQGKNLNRAGWTVYMMPTTGPAKYLELRHYFPGGGMARWVIERDGTVSAHNDEGQSKTLIPVEAAA